MFCASNFFLIPNPPPCINMGVSPNFFKITTSSIRSCNSAESKRTLPPHLMTIFSFEYFLIYFSTSRVEGPFFGQNSFILLSKFSLALIII